MLNPKSQIPQIDLPGAPEDEHDEIHLLNYTLSDMHEFVQHFQHALHLFDYCIMQEQMLVIRGPNPFENWMLMAARAAPIAIWNFRHSMAAANNYANISAYVQPRINRDLMKKANSKFDRDFPEFAALRHAVAHAGEFAKNKQAYQENTFSGSFVGFGIRVDNAPNTWIGNVLSERTYATAYAGKIVHVEISISTLNNLREIQTLFFRAFREGPQVPVAPASSG